MGISMRRLRVTTLFRGQDFSRLTDIIRFQTISRPSGRFTIHQLWLHEDIDIIFADRRVCDPLVFANFIEEKLPECSISNIALFVRLAGKKSASKSHVLLRQHLPGIASRLQKLSHSSSWRLNDISSVIYGLQCLTAEDPGYLDIVGTVTKIAGGILLKKNTLSSKNLSMLMYGLRQNSCNEQLSRNFLKVVAKIVLQCKETLSAQAVGNSLYGLQSMSNNCIEVITLVSALTVKVKGCAEIFSAQELSNALYGLQGMSSDNIEVRGLLSALIPKIHSCRESFGAQAVGNSLYGLQGMSCGSVEVRAVIQALTVKVKGCKEPLNAQAASNALYGLQRSMRSSCSHPLLDTLLLHFRNSAKESKNFQLLTYEDIKALGQGFAFSLPTLHDNLDSIKYRKWELLSQSVDNVLSTRKCDTQSMDRLPSVLEQRFQAIVLKINFAPDYHLSFNESLFHLFEGDMVLRIPIMVNENRVINFEIDGTFHLRMKKINFCLLRDKYLQSRGVMIERLPTARFIRMRDDDVAKWISEKVNEASLLPLR